MMPTLGKKERNLYSLCRARLVGQGKPAETPDYYKKSESVAAYTTRTSIGAGTPLRVPVEIFATELCPAEALVKYLKEQHALTFSDIAKLLNRDQRGIWGSYARAQRKSSGVFSLKAAAHTIPLSCFHDRSRSILEHVVTHLKDTKHLTVAHICALLQKKPSTIRTAYQRSRRKQHA